ncbi:MAG: trypsin-like peptidase domain-containing protein [Armatimonadota bacterium]
MSDRENGGHRHSHMIIILLSVLIGMVVATLACRVPAQTTTPAAAQSVFDLENEFTRVAEQVLPAVVRINVESTAAAGPTLGQLPEEFREFFRQFPWFNFPDEGEERQAPRQFRRRGVGSGWIYSQDGYIVTNAHVVQDATKVTVTLHDRPNDTKEYPATVVGTDPKTELAVVKVDAGRPLPFLTLGDSKNLKVASWVMAVGAPFELEQTVTVGVVSAKGQLIEPDPSSPQTRLGDIIQTDASINPGNSGGPLVNLRGEVVGINVAIYAPMQVGNIGIGFAIPAETARAIVPRLMEGKPIARGWLGVGIEDLTPNLKEFYSVEQGVRIASIEPNGPAANSELQVDDIVTAVEDEQVADTWDLQQAIAAREPGSTVTLTVVRNKQQRQIRVKLGQMPARYAGLPEEESPAQQPAAEQWPLGIAVMSLADLTPQSGVRLDVETEQGRVKGVPATEGVVVTSVRQGTAAAEKVAPGDVIVKVNGQPVANVEQYRERMSAAGKDGQNFVVLHLYRVIDDQAVLRAVDIEEE